MKFNAYAKVVGSKFLGVVEAESPEEAEEKAWKMDSAHVSLCHYCSPQCEDPQVDEITVEKE